MRDHETLRLDDGSAGVLFRPNGDARGTVVILHERYGLVQITLELASQLADDGFVALAPNLFSHWEGDLEIVASGAARASISDADCARLMDAWIAHLRSIARVPQRRLAVMGVCQSGRYPVVVASDRDDVDACVIFYGAASASDWEVTPDQPRRIDEMIATMKAPSFLVFAEEDHVISIGEALRLRNALERSRLSYRMTIVPGMPHGFLDWTKPGRYREREAQESWQSMLAFLDDVFERGWPGDAVEWELSARIATSYDFAKNVRLE